jgi:hypothetical protein
MCIVYDASINKFVPQDLATYVENTPSFKNKIQEVAGTAELVVEDGSTVIAKVNVYDDSTYLPLIGNNPGDQAFATDTDILYIWDGSAWQQAGASNTDDLAEGTSNLFYTDARVDARLASGSVGDVTISGNLQVNGTTTTINSSTLVVDDVNITLANGSVNAAASDGAGITADLGSDGTATILYDATNDNWKLNKALNVVNTSSSSIIRASGNASGTTVTAQLAGSLSGYGVIGTVTNHDLIVSTNDTEKLRIDSSGKLSISASDQGIQIGPDIAAYTIKRDSNGLLNFRATQTNFNGYIFDTVDGERMRIDSSGNVGIGTESPSAELEIRKDNATIYINGGGSAYELRSTLKFTRAKILTAIQDQTAYGDTRMEFHTQSAGTEEERMRIDSSGNVGIGNNAPDQLLVVGDNSTYNTIKIEGSNANLGATLKFLHHGGGDRTGVTAEWNISRGSNETSFSTGVTANGAVGGLTFWNNIVGGGIVDAMRLKDNGDTIFGYNVGIGTSNPTEKLHVAGNITATGDVTSTSDVRVKTDITPITGALNIVNKLEGKRFNKFNKPGIGFIAQELEQYMPELVHTANDEVGTKSVNYANMVALLVEAIKEQQVTINKLESKLNGN